MHWVKETQMEKQKAKRMGKPKVKGWRWAKPKVMHLERLKGMAKPTVRHWVMRLVTGKPRVMRCQKSMMPP